MIKKRLFMFGILAAFLILSLIQMSSAELNITAEPKASAVLVNSNNSAVFDLIIDAPQDDEITIYALAGMVIEPYSQLTIKKGINTIQINAFPSAVLRTQRGAYNFEYKIKDSSDKVYTNYLKITIVELKDAVSFRTLDINYGDKEVKTVVKNLHDAYIEGIKVKLSSSFIEDEITFSLKPNEEVTLISPINKNVLSLPAGSYVLKAEASFGNNKASFDNAFNYVQKEDIALKESNSGLIIRKTIVEKNNQGNVPATINIKLQKDIFSRLFTMYSLEPAKTERNGLFVTYNWERRLEPSEKLSVSMITNYTFPFFFILFVVIIVLLVYSYSKTNLILTKRVSYVKTKTGVFALKVSIHVKARKHAEDIEIIDRLPGMTMLYEKFGTKPDKIENSTRRLFYNIERLNAGEERVITYIIYSKVKVVGKFELPSSTAVFAREGKTHEVISNRTFFVADTVSR